MTGHAERHPRSIHLSPRVERWGKRAVIAAGAVGILARLAYISEPSEPNPPAAVAVSTTPVTVLDEVRLKKLVNTNPNNPQRTRLVELTPAGREALHAAGFDSQNASMVVRSDSSSNVTLPKEPNADSMVEIRVGKYSYLTERDNVVIPSSSTTTSSRV